MVDWELEKARVKVAEEQHRVVRDVDEILPTAGTKAQPLPQGARANAAHPKLDHAKDVAKQLDEDLHEIDEGLNEKFNQIGQAVASANRAEGAKERLYAGLGAMGISSATAKFNKLRRQRIRKMDLSKTILEIQNYTKTTINGLGESEQEYKVDLAGYEAAITEQLAKINETNQPFLDAKAQREILEKKVSDMEPALAKATQEERPPLEHAYEAAKRELESIAYKERTLLSTLSEAQRALPITQLSRDAAATAITAIHAMRQSSLEKFVNFRFLLSRATTALRAQGVIEGFLASDSAFNLMVTGVSRSNVSTAGAIGEGWVARARKAAVDPEAAQEMLIELLGHVDEARDDLALIEGQVSQGERMPLMEAREKVPVLAAARRAEALKALQVEEPQGEDDNLGLR